MIRVNRLFVAFLVLAAAFLVEAKTADAALVGFSFEGTVTADLEPMPPTGDPFNLDLNDTVTVTGIFDDSVLVGGTGTIDFALPGNSFIWTIGDTVFTEADAFFPLSMSILATMDLLGGALTDFGYVIVGSPGASNVGGLSFSVTTSPTTFVVSGDFDPLTFTLFAIPAPPVAALMLAAFAGLGVMRIRRRKQA